MHKTVLFFLLHKLPHLTLHNLTILLLLLFLLAYAHKAVDLTPILQEVIVGMYIGHKQVYLGLGFTHEAREKYR